MNSPTGKPCKECPFKRKSAAGYLGADTPEGFIASTLADTPMPCHLTIDYEDKEWEDEQLPSATYCSGALIFFRNMCKMSRDPNRPQLPANRDAVFSNPKEFLEHHQDIFKK